MQKPSFEKIESLNLDLGKYDFNNTYHTTIDGFSKKKSKNYDANSIGPTTLHIDFSKNRKSDKFSFQYHVSNNYRIFEDPLNINIEYDSLEELFIAIKSFGESYITKNFTNSKKMIKELNEIFDNKQQGFLQVY